MLQGYDWENMTPLGRQLAEAAGASPPMMGIPGQSTAPAAAAPTGGGAYKYNFQDLLNAVASTDLSDQHGFARFKGANGENLVAQPYYNPSTWEGEGETRQYKQGSIAGYGVFSDPGDFGGGWLTDGSEAKKMQGRPMDVVGLDGSLKSSGRITNWSDGKVMGPWGALAVLAMPFAAAAMGLGAGAAGAGASAGAAGSLAAEQAALGIGGATAAGGTGAATAASTAAAAAAGEGMLDLGGGIFMAADGSIVGATPAIASSLTNAGIMESVGAGGLGGLGGGTSALGAGGSSVFNPAVDSQLASTQLGITGSQAAADAAAAAIPSVTVNGAPTGSFLSNLTASGGLTPGSGDVGGGTVGQLGSAATSVLGNGSGTGNALTSALGGWGSLITPALQLIGGAYQASQAGNAADAMIAANDRGIAENRRQFDTVRGLLQPYVDAGTGALGAYQNLSGLKGNDVQQGEINNLTNSAQFGSLTQQGEDAILQNASATGGLRGGNTQNGLANFRSNLLTSLIDKQLGRYGSLVDVGQRSAAGTGAAALTTGTANANLMSQQGAAQAGGIVSGTNAITNALGGIGGYFAGQQAVAPQPQVSQFGTGVAAPGQVRF